MTYTVRRIASHNLWLMEPRPGRKLAGVMLHASRSGVSDGDDGPRTERWMQNAVNNQGGWGGSCDEIIFESGERVLVSHYEDEAPTYGAGYGGSGTWSAGWYYYQIEVAQGVPTDPYTNAEIDSLAQRVAELSVKHGFPIQRIAFLDQTGTPPMGICTHEASANGVEYGKSDPGNLFPWGVFMTKTQAYRDALTNPPIPDPPQEEDMPLNQDDLTRIAEIVKANTAEGLVKEVGKGAIWSVSNGMRRHIPNPAILNAEGFDWGEVKELSATDMALIPIFDDVVRGIIRAELANIKLNVTAEQIVQLAAATAKAVGDMESARMKE
mgnify:CR=1 FL=1